MIKLKQFQNNKQLKMKTNVQTAPLGKLVSRLSLLVLMCLFFTVTSIAQNTVYQSNSAITTSNAAKILIKKIEVSNHSAFGIVDGKIIITIEDLNPANSTYIVRYAVHSRDNIFTSKELTSNNNQLTLTNVIAGDYLSVKVTRVVDNKSNIVNATFNLKSASPTIGDRNTSRTQTLCTSPITFTNCFNVVTTYSNLNTETSYTTNAGSAAPCGIEIGTTCAVVRQSRWQCIQNGLSAPPELNSYTKTNYLGVNLTALQACRINHVICNNINSIGLLETLNAIWYISGTGGINNTLVAAAEAAVTAPNGNENLMIFYKSDNSSYQNMVDWTCVNAGSIGNFVWNDGNGNGLQDSGEPGLSGVQIQLLNAAGAVIATTTSDAVGYYQFTGLAAGTYTVKFLAVAGYGVSPANVGTNDAIDSDVDGTGSVTVVLGAGETNQTIDAGFCPTTLALGDRVFADVNNNGIRDATELGIAGVTVNIYQDANNDNIADGPAFASAVTDANGNYLFSNLLPGNYIIGVINPAGYASSTTNAGDPDNDIDVDDNGQVAVGNETRGLAITLTGGGEPGGSNTNLTYDFGFYPASVLSLGNVVWSDLNNNGIKDAGEPGIGGVTVWLFNDFNNDGIGDNTGNPNASTVTDGSGNYSFNNLVPGSYFVGIQIPANYLVATVPASGTNANNDTDNDNNLSRNQQGYNVSSTITLSIGGEPTNDGDGANGNLTLDFGLFNPYGGCYNSQGVDDFATTATVVPVGSRPSPTVVSAAYTNAGSFGGFMTNTITGRNTFGNTQLNSATAPGVFDVATGAGDSIGNVMVWDGDNNPAINPTGLVCRNLSAFQTLDFIYTDDRIAGTVETFELILYSSAGNASKVVFTYIAAGNNIPKLVSIPFSSLVAVSGLGNVNLSCVGAIVLKHDIAGANNNGLDFSMGKIQFCTKATPGAIGDFVFNDLNGNGIQDAGEPGLAGSTVTLFDANGNIMGTTTTTAAGTYQFGNLPPGTYSVSFTTPAGFVPTGSNLGGNDNTDSDPINGVVTGIVLVAGQTITNVDAGFRGTGSIGDFVWNDTNGNGIQEAGEVGINGVIVELKNAAGVVIATTTTNSVGYYQFTGLVAGTYTLQFVTPSGYAISPAFAGSNPAIDSDIDVNSGTVTVTLASGESNQTIDAGYVLKNLSLGDRVWYDQNNNGIQDAGETGIAGATVRLYNASGTVIGSTTTSATGTYSFAGLTPGAYSVGVDIPAGYAAAATTATSATPDNDNNTDNNGVIVTASVVRTNNITLTAGGEPINDGDASANSNLSLDLGLKGTGSIGDFVWNDANGNGIQDAGEVGIGGVLVTLTYPNGQTATTTTAADGSYIFANLAPGTTYSVAFGTPAGYSPTGSNLGVDDNTDSDPIGGVVTGVTVTAGVANKTIDAGFVVTNLSLGDRVWYDQNNNGIQDAGETGISGVTVRLYNVLGVSIATTTTSATGIYNFAGLTPGVYAVGIDIPSGYAPAATTATSANADNDNNTDNNGVSSSATVLYSGNITLTAGGEPINDGDASANSNLSLDLGLKGTGSIGDYVWNDVNSNGVQDITESGIVGATVTLTYPNGTTVSTTTGAGGIYNFPNLAPGTYSVTFTTPAGLVASPSNVTGAGITDLNDSDPISGVVSGIVLSAGQVNNTVDAGFYACTLNTVSFSGPLTICANEGALFNAVGQGSGSVYTWTFNGGTPATGTGSSFTSAWSTPGEYDITLTVTKNGCTGTFTRSIIITQAVVANAGPDADICSGSSTTLVGGGPAGSSYSWTVVSGDPTSIDNGANQSSVLVSPLVTTVYRLTVSQNGCTRIDDVTVSINVNKNPTANAGPNKRTIIGVPVTIGGSPTGTPPVAQPNAPLGYTWSPSTGLNDATVPNPTVTINTAGTYNYQVIVYNQLTGCSDTSLVSVTVEVPVNIGNKVFYDKNNNGTQDATDQGIAGVTVKLYEDADGNNIPDGAAVATTTTVGTAGTYNFGNLFAGKYIVGIVIPTGYVAGATTATSTTTDNDNNTDNNGVNASSTEIRSNFVTVTVGGEPAAGVDGDGTNGNLTVDFGLTGTAKLGNYVWQDQNRNGIQDAGEVGIANAVVTLTYPDGTLLNTTTSATGAYAFDNLEPGTYNVKFTTPVGYTATLANVTTAGANDLNDSDPNATGNVTGIVLNAGDDNQTVDAGFYPPLNIYGNVWHDVNGLTNNEINNTVGATPIPTGLYIYLVNRTTGLIEKRGIVLNDGTFKFLDVSAATSYKIVYSTSNKLVGETPPKSFLPSGWVAVGEHLGAGINSGSDGIANGELFLNTGYIDIFNANFGIQKKNGEVVIG
jgi:hypothetical protein